jgi:hypothetical protein
MSKGRGGNRAAQNNRSNQLNPNNPAYQGSRQGSGTSKPAMDNRSNQLNPEHPAYEGSHRGGEGGPSGSDTE